MSYIKEKAEAVPNHVHMFVRIPPKYIVPEVIRYCVDAVGKNAYKIEEYIRNSLKEDCDYEQMTLKKHIDMFAGESLKSRQIR